MIYPLLEEQGLDPDQVESFLESLADDIQDNFSFRRELSDAELAELSIQIESDAMSIDSLETQFAEIKKEWSAKIKSAKLGLKVAISKKRTRSENTSSRMFLIRDFDSGKMLYVTANGEIQFERPLKPEERQTSIHSLNQRNGTQV